jgi:DNA-binding CsgD family transcriptional regulator/anti-sigma regulatory factor (Ser/Thr protein kinase)
MSSNNPRLTEREHQVLSLLRQGMTNQEIGHELYLGVETIRTHVRPILRKLGVVNRTQAGPVRRHRRPRRRPPCSERVRRPMRHERKRQRSGAHVTGWGRMKESNSSRHRRHVFAASPSSVRDARAFVASVLTDARLPTEVMSTLRLVVSELVSNAVEHCGGDVEVGLDLSDDQWLEVAVSGRSDVPAVWADSSQWVIASPDGRSGRGLGIVRSLVDDLST